MIDWASWGLSWAASWGASWGAAPVGPGFVASPWRTFVVSPEPRAQVVGVDARRLEPLA